MSDFELLTALKWQNSSIIKFTAVVHAVQFIAVLVLEQRFPG